MLKDFILYVVARDSTLSSFALTLMEPLSTRRLISSLSLCLTYFSYHSFTCW